MSSITRHTHILGFSTPVVNGGDVCVPVRGPRGLFHFVAPPQVWMELLHELRPLLLSEAKPRTIAGKADLFRAHWRRFIADPNVTSERFAKDVGIPEPTLRYWFKKFASEPGAPALRPGGKL